MEFRQTYVVLLLLGTLSVTLILETTRVAAATEGSICNNTTLNNCSSDALCTDLDDGFNCTCNEGFVGDGINCTLNECYNSSLNNCSINAQCVDEDNGFSCTCNEGFVGDGVTCNLNECVNATLNNCSSDALCTDLDDGFNCTCNEGFAGDGVVCNVNECSNTTLNNCSSDALCTDLDDGFNCTCNEGFAGDGVVCNVNECVNASLNNCSSDALCTDLDDGFSCTCNEGFVGDGVVCNVNLCFNKTLNNCSEDALCTYVENGFNCTCNEGFVGDGVVCNLNECYNTSWNNCSIDANCTDLDEGFSCTCNDGYTGNGTTCEDINECDNSTLNDCDKQHGTCKNQFGSYICGCVDGYVIDGRTCKNIDECSNNTLNQCDENANCTDTDGNYTCTCHDGYQGNGYTCEDIDECSNSTLNSCHEEYGTCQNTDGSYNCSCKNGFRGDGENCENIDECSNATLNNCSKTANCTDTVGSFNCTCHSGYEGDGYICTDVDECSNKPCKHGGFCQNEYGSYKCFCNKHWTGLDCSEDVDECLNPVLNDCSQSANCNSSGNIYTCTCKDGYKGNGKHCTKILLLEPAGEHMDNSDDKVYGPFTFPFAFPYFDKMYYTAYVSTNGYITLDEKYEEKYCYNVSAIPNTRTVIAPFWADIDFTESATDQGVFVGQFVSSDRSGDDVTEMMTSISALITNYKPKYALVATWKKATPYPSGTFSQHETASFQAILTTDGQNSYLIFNYDKDDMGWTPGQVDAVVGYSNESFVVVADTTEKAMNLTENTNIDTPGRWIFPVAALPTPDKLFKCHQFLISNSSAEIQEQQNKMNSTCPCNLQQALLDLRYKEMPQPFRISNGQCFEPRFANGGTDGKLACCYDSERGNLRIGVPNGGFYVSKKNEGTKDGWEDCCEDSLNMCRKFYETHPSVTCERYSQPGYVFGWGDPHIQMFSGTVNTFNGWGEYILMKTNSNAVPNFEIQARTFKPDTFNATVFSALVFQENSGDIIEVRAANSLEVYINGLPTSSETDFKEGFLNFSDSNEVKIIFESDVLLEISFVDNRLAFKLSVPNTYHELLSGIVGSYPGDGTEQFQYRNGTEVKSSPSEAEMFDFITSWSLFNESESLFNYTLDGAIGFNDFQNLDFVPRFYQDEFSENSTVLFGNVTNLISVTQICSQSIQCMLDLAATGDEGFANTTRDQYFKMKRTTTLLNNHPPAFSYKQNFVQVTVGKNANFQVNISDDHSTTVDVTVDTSIQNYSLQYENMEANFSFVLYDTTSVYLKLIANDSLGATNVLWMEIRLCNCVHGECAYNPSSIYNINQDQFLLLTCNCEEGYTGSTCDTPIDICAEKDLCYPGVTCNSTNTDKPCGPCPVGLLGDGKKCYDKNECYDKGACPENSVCRNTEGSFHCDCNTGFVLSSDKKSCKDKNECLQQDICTDDKYCLNLPGSFECKCRPRSFKISSSDTCKKALYVFGGVLKIMSMPEFNQGWTDALLDSQTDQFKSLATKVTNTLNAVFKDQAQKFLIAVVNSFSKKSVNRRKRETSTESIIESDYSLYYDAPMSENDLKAKLDSNFESCSGQYCSLGSGDDVILAVDKNSPVTDSKDLCASPNDNNCDTTSTNCTSSNGTFACHCKTGYDHWDLSEGGNVCQDIDECATEVSRTEHCGTIPVCINSPGSYECTCPHGFVFENKNCKDVCAGDPCKNDGECIKEESFHKCKCTDGWTGFSCELEDPKVESLRKILIGVGAGVGSLCLILLVVIICCARKRQNSYKKHSMSGADEWSGIPRPHVRRNPDNVEMVENGSHDKFNILSDDFEENSNKGYNRGQPVTKFSRPSTEAYDNPSYSSSEETRHHKL